MFMAYSRGDLLKYEVDDKQKYSKINLED